MHCECWMVCVVNAATSNVSLAKEIKNAEHCCISYISSSTRRNWCIMFGTVYVAINKQCNISGLLSCNADPMYLWTASQSDRALSENVDSICPELIYKYMQSNCLLFCYKTFPSIFVRLKLLKIWKYCYYSAEIRVSFHILFNLSNSSN